MMSYKVLVLFGVLCIFCSCFAKGDEDSSQGQPDIPMEPLDETPSEVLQRDSSVWGFLQPWKLWKWGQSVLNEVLTSSAEAWPDPGRHVHSGGGQRGKIKNKHTLTRRESSLIVHKRGNNYNNDYDDWMSTTRQSTARLVSDSSTSVLTPRPKGAIRKELVTMMFESMLGCIVKSWKVIEPPKQDTLFGEFPKSSSETTFTGVKKKKQQRANNSSYKTARTRSRSKLSADPVQIDPMHLCWWSSPDERAVIRFKNGNIYEGDISMKCMHGEGRYQWADGSIYLGHFEDNKIKGKGLLLWKDDAWYQGDFSGNLRFGKGLYVDPRRQRSYYGGWHCGTKHGEGIIYYNGMKNSYDGDWVYNVRDGFGSREYSPSSGYQGEWDKYVREGKGLMIWPNQDFYRGEWKNGVMSGSGVYIWNAFYNNSLSLPSINAYRGQWEKGQRKGYGVLNLGLGMGSHYKGEFKDNKKHGQGKFVTNNGLIIQGSKLFQDDNIGSLLDSSENLVQASDRKKNLRAEPYQFDICDTDVGMIYHVKQALKNVDRQAEIRAGIINDYMEINNKSDDPDAAEVSVKPDSDRLYNIEDIIAFEESSLHKSVKCYRVELKNIYHKYATIYNSERISVTPILIRLYLWQFYYDCSIHQKGLTLVEIDRMFHQNPDWLSKSPHNPFEKIYFWQFIHSLISVASKMYAKREMPGIKPDTILASAFRKFMDMDVLPGVGSAKGRLANGFASLIPLRGTYLLYRSLGEPHTVRTFLRAVRGPMNLSPQVDLIDVPDESLVIGRNAFVYGDELTYVTKEVPCTPQDENYLESVAIARERKLYNFANLSIKSIIGIFSKIFPKIIQEGKIVDLEVEITFFEFFEAFVACAEESIRVKDEEIKWRAKFALQNPIHQDQVSPVLSATPPPVSAAGPPPPPTTTPYSPKNKIPMA